MLTYPRLDSQYSIDYLPVNISWPTAGCRDFNAQRDEARACGRGLRAVFSTESPDLGVEGVGSPLSWLAGSTLANAAVCETDAVPSAYAQRYSIWIH
jgi:hypothetical protein